MLASARLGAVQSVVFGGFASREVAARIDDARPKLFFFFSSRRRHTRSLCDWSSDVCSSDLADALGCDRVSLVGHDWGGLVAWWTAARHGERVERLAILNAPHPQAFGPYLRRHPTQL